MQRLPVATNLRHCAHKAPYSLQELRLDFVWYTCCMSASESQHVAYIYRTPALWCYLFYQFFHCDVICSFLFKYLCERDEVI